MFLKRLKLENVRCIDSLEIDFRVADVDGDVRSSARGINRKWTMILGQNGTGKSSILRASALILAGSDALTELLGTANKWIQQDQSFAEIQAEVETAEGEPRELRLRIPRDKTILDILELNRDSLKAIDAALAHTQRSYFFVGYGASRRLSSKRMAQFGETYKHPRAQAVSTLFSSDANLNPLESWAMNLAFSRPKSGIEIIRSALAEIMPDVTFLDIDRETGDLMFDTPDGVIPLSQLSDGYQNMAAWCGDLLFRITSAFKDYKKPLEARGLLLLDEIDLHLHPVWQRQLHEFITNKLPNIQIIATTHSALTAQQSGPGELYFLQRGENAQAPKLEPFRGSPNLLLAHQILASPAFGVKTLDSKYVEDLKTRYRQIKAISSNERSRSEAKEFKELSELLESLPTYPMPSRSNADLESLLQDVRTELKLAKGEK